MGVQFKDVEGDSKISFYIVFYFVALIANATIKTVLPIPDSLWGLISIAWGVLIVFFLLRCIKIIWRRNRQIVTISLVLFTTIHLFSFISIMMRGEPSQGFWKGSVFVNYAYWIPIGLAIASVKDKKIFFDMFYKWSYAMSILLFLCVFFRRTNELMEGETEYNMFFGFQLVIPALFHITQYYMTKDKKVLAFFIFEVLLLIIYANRGALIPIVVYFLFRTFLKQNAGSQRGFANVFFIITMAAIVMIFSGPIFTALDSFSSALGIRSRTLTMMANGNVMDSSGRDELADISFAMISERPILGWGLGGEFWEIGKRMGVVGVDFSSAAFSPHNGILEMWVCFGVVLGTIALLIFIVPMLRIRTIREPYTAMLILILGAAVVAPCMISADGLLIKPGAAMYVYLYYLRNHRIAA